eukprot:TRINITY_DN3850_c0_g2_i1.p1 TRINITY_DN3850_c0_g2~~TRINITY_DN3850_c0_g2_i1.p1  ORF type:complete len:365 (+),score=122.56 TRINITY_DN3850_c0_g2_i1:194-1288(+)
MSEIKFKVKSCTSENSAFPSNNLEKSMKRWETDGPQEEATVDLKFNNDHLSSIEQVTIGNFGCAFIELLVDRNNEDDWKVLMPITQILKVGDTINNKMREWKFKDELRQTKKEKWDSLRIYCRQPWTSEAIGLTSVKILSNTSGEKESKNEKKEDSSSSIKPTIGLKKSSSLVYLTDPDADSEEDNLKFNIDNSKLTTTTTSTTTTSTSTKPMTFKSLKENHSKNNTTTSTSTSTSSTTPTSSSTMNSVPSSPAKHQLVYEGNSTTLFSSDDELIMLSRALNPKNKTSVSLVFKDESLSSCFSVLESLRGGTEDEAETESISGDEVDDSNDTKGKKKQSKEEEKHNDNDEMLEDNSEDTEPMEC